MGNPFSWRIRLLPSGMRRRGLCRTGGASEAARPGNPLGTRGIPPSAGCLRIAAPQRLSLIIPQTHRTFPQKSGFQEVGPGLTEAERTPPSEASLRLRRKKQEKEAETRKGESWEKAENKGARSRRKAAAKRAPGKPPSPPKAGAAGGAGRERKSRGSSFRLFPSSSPAFSLPFSFPIAVPSAPSRPLISPAAGVQRFRTAGGAGNTARPPASGAPAVPARRGPRTGFPAPAGRAPSRRTANP